MDTTILTIIFSCCTTAHLVMTAVMGIFARRQVRYLSIAWIMGIFTAILAIVTPYSEAVANGQPGLLHPGMLAMLVVGTYLQSIYTLGLTMPGYLQWRRMWTYAIPVIVLGLACAVDFPTGQFTKIFTWQEFAHHIVSLDMIMRLAAVGLGVYYVLNIFLLPRRLTRSVNFPTYLLGYITLLGFSAAFYIHVCVNYDPVLLGLYVVMVTIINAYLCLHTVEDLSTRLPQPRIDADIEDSVTADAKEEEEEKRLADFNEANLDRYRRLQHWMQNNRDAWTDYTFNRDRLCEATGINRQLMLQCLRSQGHNNVHDYLTAYRVEELKRLIMRGEIKSVSECDMAGFAAPRTARVCFERIESRSLDEFVARCQKKES